MKSYKDTIKEDSFIYFYDFGLKLWTVFEVDSKDNQLSEADYFHNKKQMLAKYSFKFNTYES
jgi:hypothetical protein